MSPSIQLVARDFEILETMLERRAEHGGPLVPLLREKISSAVVVFREDLPARTVSLSSKVVFRVNAQAPQTCVLVETADNFFEGETLSIHSMRGLSMLGLPEGQIINITNEDGDEEKIEILEVRNLPSPSAQPRGSVTAFPLHRVRPPAVPTPDDDLDPDPGPAAA